MSRENNELVARIRKREEARQSKNAAKRERRAREQEREKAEAERLGKEAHDSFFQIQPMGQTPMAEQYSRQQDEFEREAPPSKRQRRNHEIEREMAQRAMNRAAEMPANASIRPSRREIIYHRDGFKCVNCDSEIGLTLDHIIPSSRGGSNLEQNLQTLCKFCNNMKGDAVGQSAKRLLLLAKTSLLNPHVANQQQTG